jgi:hypothetical protein
MATGGVANVLYAGTYPLSLSLVLYVQFLLFHGAKLKTQYSPVPLPWHLRNRLCLFSLQHLPVPSHRRSDIHTLLLVPSHLPRFVCASDRIPLHPSLDRQFRYHHDECQPVRRRHGGGREVAGAVHDWVVLGRLRACCCYVAGDLLGYVSVLRRCDCDVCLAETDAATGGPRRHTPSTR